MTEPRVQRLRMLRARPASRAQSRSHHHRNSPRAARHVMDLRRLVHHLVHRESNEIAKHNVDHGPQSRHRGAHRDTREARFRNRCVQHPLSSEFLDQSRKHLKGRARLGHVFAENADSRVAAHLFRERLSHRLAESEFPRNGFRHKRLAPLPRCRDTERPRQTRPPSSSPIPLPMRIKLNRAESARPWPVSQSPSNLMGSRSVFQCFSSSLER